MGFTLRKTARFEEDLEGVILYYVDVVDSPRAAASFSDTLEKAFRLLEENPFIKAVSKKPELSSGSYREYFVGPYAIVYRVDEQDVVLLRLLHQMQDFGRAVLS